MFRWFSMGFEVQHESGKMVEVAHFNDIISEDSLENLFNLGYYFYHPVHRVSIESMEDYEKYIVLIK